jgi:hypothetical protein
MPSSSTMDFLTIGNGRGARGRVSVGVTENSKDDDLTIDRWHDPSMTIHFSRPYSTHLITLQSSKLHGSQLPRLATEFGHPLVLLILWPLRCCVEETRVEFVTLDLSNDRCQLWSYVHFTYNTAIHLERQPILSNLPISWRQCCPASFVQLITAKTLDPNHHIPFATFSPIPYSSTIVALAGGPAKAANR